MVNDWYTDYIFWEFFSLFSQVYTYLHREVEPENAILAVHISMYQGVSPAPTVQVSPPGFLLTLTTCLSLGLQSLNHPPPGNDDAFGNCGKSTVISLFSQPLLGCLHFHVQDEVRGHFPWQPYAWWLRCTPRACGAPRREDHRREGTTNLHHWPYCWQQRRHWPFKRKARCSCIWQWRPQTLLANKKWNSCLANEVRSRSSKLPETWSRHTGEANCSSLAAGKPSTWEGAQGGPVPAGLGLCYVVPWDPRLSRLLASTPFALGERAEEGKPGTNPFHLLQSS